MPTRNPSCLLSPDRPLDPVGTRPRLDSMSSVEEEDYDTLTDIESDKNVIRTKVSQPLASGQSFTPRSGAWVVLLRLLGRQSSCAAREVSPGARQVLT